MRVIAVMMMALLLAGCEKEPRTKVDDSLTADLFSDHIQQLKHDPAELAVFDYIKSTCDTPKQECTQIGTSEDCVTVIIPQCSQLEPIAQSIADTIAGCNGNASSFCADFIQQTQTIKLADLPVSSQSTYGLTVDTPYFRGSHWQYWTEVYPITLRLLETVLYFLMIMPGLYLAIRYYFRRKPTIITAPPLPTAPTPAEPDAMALKTQQEAHEAAQRLEAVRKQVEQKKREIEALKAAEEAKKQQQAKLAEEEANRKRQETASNFKNLLD